MRNFLTSQSPIEVYLAEKQFIALSSIHDKNVPTQNLLELILCAKSYFIQEKYQKSINIIELIKSLENQPSKILYQRQTLLFKCQYLLSPTNLESLEQILEDYQKYQEQCVGDRLTDYHSSQLSKMMKVVIEGIQKQKNSSGLDKIIFKHDMKQYNKQLKKFEGIPSYIISVSWAKKLHQFLNSNGPYPGPVTNFDLINHIYEMHPHTETAKQYMNVLMFRVTEQEKYRVISEGLWRLLKQTFGGTQIKRLYALNNKNGQISGADDLIKIHFLHQNRSFVQQWQPQTFWDKTVLPCLTRRLGTVQVKDKNVILSQKIYQPSSILQVVYVDFEGVREKNKKQLGRKKQICLKFDLQQFNPNLKIDRQTQGLSHGSCSHANSCLQILNGLSDLVDWFLSNQFFKHVNLTSSPQLNSNGFVAFAFADLLKKMWFSNSQKFIDPSNIKLTLKNSTNSPISCQIKQKADQFMVFLLNCLHDDLRNNFLIQSNSQNEAKNSNSVSKRLKFATQYYSKSNHSTISKMLRGLLYSQIACQKCKSVEHKVDPFWMFEIDVPQTAPKIQVYVMEKVNLKEAKKIQVHTSTLKTVGQVVDAIKQFFVVKADHQILCFLYFENEKQWEFLDLETKLIHVERAVKKKGGFFFMHEIHHPQPDQEISMFSYYFEKDNTIILDGFPRFMITKKAFRETDYRPELDTLIFNTVPQKKLIRDQKDYIKQITVKQSTGQKYSVNYRILMAIQIKNYTNATLLKILCQIQQPERFSLEVCIRKQSKSYLMINSVCSKCKGIQTLWKKTRIYQVPQYFLIHFKRFTEDGKIKTKIEYPIEKLDIGSLTISSNQLCLETNLTTINSSTQFLKPDLDYYQLEGIVTHRGSKQQGHYSCIRRNSNKTKWMLYDDETVRDFDESQLVDANAYVLAYSKKL